nr:hypothetical protein CFP56_11819 [Quercus suber]
MKRTRHDERRRITRKSKRCDRKESAAGKKKKKHQSAFPSTFFDTDSHEGTLKMRDAATPKHPPPVTMRASERKGADGEHGGGHAAAQHAHVDAVAAAADALTGCWGGGAGGGGGRAAAAAAAGVGGRGAGDDAGGLVGAGGGGDGEGRDEGAVGAVDAHLDGGLGDGDEGAGGRAGDAGGDEGGGAVRGGGDAEVGVEARVGDEVGVAGGRGQRGGGAVARLEEGDVQLGVLAGEGVIVGPQGGGAVGEVVDQAEHVDLLRPFVDQAAGEALHQRAVEGGDLVEDARHRVVTAVLAEEDGDGGVGEEGDQLVVAGGLEAGAGATPAVGVEAEKVGPGRVIAAATAVVALQVGPAVHEDVVAIQSDVGSAVPDRDDAIGMGCDVVLQIALDGTDVGGIDARALEIVDDLVAGEEAEGVGVGLEGLHDGEDVLQIRERVGGGGIVAIDVLAGEGRVDIDQHVDAHVVEDGGAVVVVEGGVEIVDADGVDAERLHQGGIAQADGAIGEGIGGVGGANGALSALLVVDADDDEAVVGDGVDELLLFHDDGVDGADGGGEGRDAGEEGGKLGVGQAMLRGTGSACCGGRVLRTGAMI